MPSEQNLLERAQFLPLTFIPPPKSLASVYHLSVLLSPACYRPIFNLVVTHSNHRSKVATVGAGAVAAAATAGATAAVATAARAADGMPPSPVAAIAAAVARTARPVVKRRRAVSASDWTGELSCVLTVGRLFQLSTFDAQGLADMLNSGEEATERMAGTKASCAALRGCGVRDFELSSCRGGYEASAPRIVFLGS